jgi:hypothetical protein
MQCQKHLDRKNTGESLLIGLGDYKGGELVVWEDKESPTTTVDISSQSVQFDGSKLYHETAPFEGERYSLVFYK